MAKILITGANGGIGRHLCRHLSTQHDVIPLVRNPSKDSAYAPCDLTKEIPRPKDPADNGASEVDWIVHLATSYQVEGDLMMLENLIDFAEQRGIRNLLYVSSWVVHFPHRILSASYIKMKRQCERRVMASGMANVRIIRPSVVEGPDLSWTNLLARLSPFASLIPLQVSRSFVTIDEVCRLVDSMIDGRCHSQVVTCLGERMPLGEKARQYQSSGDGRAQNLLFVSIALLGVAFAFTLYLAPQMIASLLLAFAGCASMLLALRLTLPAILGSLSDYFAGFVVRKFEPETEQDVIALCHRDNHSIQVRGYDNARLYFQRRHSHYHTTVCLRYFDGILNIDRNRNLVSVEAGAHFGKLLPLLESSGLWLDNYPNYHFISVGACIATAVHGSNLDKPFLADLVESIRYYDREEDELVDVQRKDPRFAELIFHRDADQRRVILAAQLKVCQREYYELSSERRSVAALSFDKAESFAGGAEHYEVRINTPMSRDAYLQSYRPVCVDAHDLGTSGSLRIKADAIGRKWNFLQSNAVCSLLTSWVSRFFVNYEWFFTPEEFSRFWSEISSDRSKYRMYKLLIRYNRRQSDANTRYHGTVSIDVTVVHTRTMLNLSAALYERYRPLEHLGKYSIERFIQQTNDTVVESTLREDMRSSRAIAD